MQQEITMPSLPHCLNKLYFSTFFIALHCRVVAKVGEVVHDGAAARYKSPSPPVVPTLEHFIFVISSLPPTPSVSASNVNST